MNRYFNIYNDFFWQFLGTILFQYHCHCSSLYVIFIVGKYEKDLQEHKTERALLMKIAQTNSTNGSRVFYLAYSGSVVIRSHKRQNWLLFSWHWLFLRNCFSMLHIEILILPFWGLVWKCQDLAKLCTFKLAKLCIIFIRHSLPTVPNVFPVTIMAFHSSEQLLTVFVDTYLEKPFLVLTQLIM